MKAIPEHGSCFVCGSENPHSMSVTWFEQDDGTIYAELTMTLAQQGPPGYVHGGASAAVLDEAMGAAVWQAGFTAVAVNINVDYRRPVPLNQPVTVTAQITDCPGRTIRARSELLLADGSVAVVARGIYVEAPQLFQKSGFDTWHTSQDTPDSSP